MDTVTVENARLRVTVTRSIWDSYREAAEVRAANGGSVEKFQRAAVLSDAMRKLAAPAPVPEPRANDPEFWRQADREGNKRAAVRCLAAVMAMTDRAVERGELGHPAWSLLARGENAATARDRHRDSWEIEVLGPLPKTVGTRRIPAEILKTVNDGVGSHDA